VVTSSRDTTVQVWDAKTGTPIGKSIGHKNFVQWAEFSPDGARVVTASKNMVQVWDPANGPQIGKPMQHDDTVWTADFSPDGLLVLTASGDTTARIWDAATGESVGQALRQPVRSPGRHSAVMGR
jgi:WD40 repeat protein